MTAPIRSERGFDRLVNFGDAIVAIAITLLVLPLVELPTSSPGKPLDDLLKGHWFELLAFVLSFLVIGRLWRIHHELFEQLTTYDEGLIRWQMLWLLTIVFLPFPTQLLGGGDNGRAESALYIGTLFACSVSLSLMKRHIDRHPELCVPEEDRGRIDSDGHTIADGTNVTPALFGVAFVLAATIPGVGAWALLVLLLDRPLERALLSRRVARPT